ncbi:putative ribonuclease H-like domain-containing protein, partial [Tanacetum coccineum]
MMRSHQYNLDHVAPLPAVYVDDIIFGSTNESLCDEFEGLMHKRFQMSSMRGLTFFLGLQVQQKEDGIFIRQDKYVAEILKKFNFATVKTGRKIVDLDADAEVTLMDETQEMNDDNLMFDTGMLEEHEKDVAEKEVSVVDPVTTAGEVVTIANVEVTTINA